VIVTSIWLRQAFDTLDSDVLVDLDK